MSESTLYTLWLDEKQAGPYTLDELKSMSASGAIPATTLFSTEGKADWQPIAMLFKSAGESKEPIYNVRMKGDRFQASQSALAFMCKARMVNSCAKCRKHSSFFSYLWKPISKFPEFRPYVRHTTIEEEELNPNPDAACYLSCGDQQTGPFTPAQIRSMWNAGSITSDVLFYNDAMGEWRPVKRFCQNEKWADAVTTESQLLKQLVVEQKKSSSHLRAIRWAIGEIIALVFILYQCARH